MTEESTGDADPTLQTARHIARAQGSKATAKLDKKTVGLTARLTVTSVRSKFVGAASLAFPGMAIVNGEAKFGFQTPQTIVAHQIYDLHTVILVICILIAVVVFAFMFYAIVRHRRSVQTNAAAISRVSATHSEIETALYRALALNIEGLIASATR